MGKVIAVSGKGGVGKTIISTLLVRWLAEKKVKSILAIDADPDSNLAESLGVEFEKSMGDIREELSDVRLAAGVEKKKYLEGKIFEITVETDDFDLLVMGRPEGPGCYCAVNHMLRLIIDATTEAYEYTVVDTEAGLEHLSRRTTENVDVMFIVTDVSRKGFQTAARIKELAQELNIKFDKIFLILNRVKKEDAEIIKEAVKLTGLEVIMEIPEDPLVREYDLKGIPVIKLPADSQTYTILGSGMEAIGWI